MACLVAGANFLLQELRDEAFTFSRGQKKFLPHLSENPSANLFPYLLVNIGSGVSILRVRARRAGGGGGRAGGVH